MTTRNREPRDTVTLTSLTEDLQFIGELPREEEEIFVDDPDFGDPNGENTGDYYATGADPFEPEGEDPNAVTADGEVDPEGEETGLSAEEIARLESVALKTANLTEKMGRRNTAARMALKKHVGFSKQHRLSSAERHDNHQQYVRNKAKILAAARKRSKTASFKHARMIHQRKLAAHGGPKAGFRFRTEETALDRISQLAEDCRDLARQNEELDQNLVLRSFSEMALLFNKLGKAFQFYGEQTEDPGFIDLSKQCLESADECADITDQLNAGTFEGTYEQLEAYFNPELDTLMEGIDIYNNMRALIVESSETVAEAKSGGSHARSFLSGKRSMETSEMMPLNRRTHVDRTGKSKADKRAAAAPGADTRSARSQATSGVKVSTAGTPGDAGAAARAAHSSRWAAFKARYAKN